MMFPVRRIMPFMSLHRETGGDDVNQQLLNAQSTVLKQNGGDLSPEEWIKRFLASGGEWFMVGPDGAPIDIWLWLSGVDVVGNE
jgi:hypothetical protein